MARHRPDTHLVVPSSKGGGSIKRGGADRAAGHFDTKREAVDYGRQVSRNHQTQLRIHNKDGRISQSDSHAETQTRRRDENHDRDRSGEVAH